MGRIQSIGVIMILLKPALYIKAKNNHLMVNPSKE